MMAGRPGHPAAPARLRSDSGRSCPRPRAVRSPTRALRRGPAAPRLLPTAPRRAGGPTPPDPRPRQPGQAAAGPGSIAPCPPPGPAPARTGRGRPGQRRAYQLDPLWQVRARHPFGHAHHAPPRRPDRSSAQECGRALGTWCPGGRPARGPVLRSPWATACTVANTHGTLPHRRAMLHQGAVLSSDDFGSSVGWRGGGHPVYGGWVHGRRQGGWWPVMAWGSQRMGVSVLIAGS
jgi:hypothetical protein